MRQLPSRWRADCCAVVTTTTIIFIATTFPLATTTTCWCNHHHIRAGFPVLASSFSSFHRQQQRLVVRCGLSRSCIIEIQNNHRHGRHHCIMSSSSLHSRSTTCVLPPLIDVDCNLWHKDLQQPLVMEATAMTNNNNNNNNNNSSNNNSSNNNSGKKNDTAGGSWSMMLSHDALTETNVVAMVSPSSTLDESRRGLLQVLEEQQQQDDNDDDDDKTKDNQIQIRTTVGIHPYHVNDPHQNNNNDDDDHACRTTTMEQAMNELQGLLERARVTSSTSSSSSSSSSSTRVLLACVGECGLDASDGFPPLHDQIPYFSAQVALAQQYRLPLFVHERLAFHETMDVLANSTEQHKQLPLTVPVLIHCFTGTREECRQYVERGYHVSVSGFVCKQGAVGEEVRQCLREGLIPLDRLMVETDAPYMGFDNCRTHYLSKHADAIQSLNAKKRKRLTKGLYPNLPSSLPLVVDAVVEALNAGRQERGEEILARDEVALQMTRNAIAFFGFDGSRIQGL